MNKFITLLKKTIMLQPAFLLAILLHFLLFFIPDFSGGDAQNKHELKTLIPVQMSYGNGKASGQSGAPAAKNNQLGKTISPAIEVAANPSSLSAATEQGAGSPSGTGTGNGNGTGTGTGPGNGTGFGFAESVVNFKEPQYPITALKRGIEGTLKVRIKVSEEGAPLESTILVSSNNKILDNAALKVIPEWRFQKRAGVSFYFVEKTFVFKIKS